MEYKKRHKSDHISISAFTSCISTTLMLVLLGTIVFFIMFAYQFSNTLRENFTVTLLLDDEMSQSETYQLQQHLRALPCSRLVTYISKERALKEQSEALGSDPSEFSEENPMPASFEIHLNADYVNDDSLAFILPQFRQNPKILDVSYPQSLMKSLNSNINKISSIMLVIALLLTLVSFVLINNTIRLSVYSHRFLIHTMKLVGANWSFIRRPFLVQAVVIGLVSGLLASAILAGGLYALVNYEPQMLPMLNWNILAVSFGIVFVCGILLTLICAFFTVSRTLRMKSDKLYRY